MAKLSQFNFESNQNEKNQKEENNIEKDVMNKFNEFKDMSQDQLSQTLFEEVARQKREGSFNYEALENMVESIRGSLSVNDYQNLKRMLLLLK